MSCAVDRDGLHGVADAAQFDGTESAQGKPGAEGGDLGTEADAGAEALVGFLQAGGAVHHFAMGGIVETLAPADIADHGVAGMKSDPRLSEPEFGRQRCPAEGLGEGVDRLGAVDRVAAVVGE